MADVHNGMDIIDSRDVIKRIEELEEYREYSLDQLQSIKAEISALEAKETRTSDEEDQLQALRDSIFTDEDKAATEYAETSDWTDEEAEELRVLKALEEEASGSPDWTYGETLIRDTYFEEYAQELAADIGAIQSDASWPNNFIDWEAAADALKADYSSVDFDGETYWIRS